MTNQQGSGDAASSVQDQQRSGAGTAEMMADGQPAALIKTDHLGEPHIVAGDRAYLIGAQDGSFPDAGWHDPGEMHGVWAHPIKLLDGFWLAVDDVWLTEARRFVSGPFWSRQDYEVGPDLRVVRTQFVPDGELAVVVRFVFHSPRTRHIRCRLLARTDLRPVWEPGRPVKRTCDLGRYDDRLQSWCCENAAGGAVVIGASSTPAVCHESTTECWGPAQCAGLGLSVLLSYDLVIATEQPAHLDLVVAGSSHGLPAAANTFTRVCDTIPSLWNAKSARYGRMLERTTITVPDPDIQRAWDWLKCNYDWLVRDVPGLGRGLGAGVPEYPWWFGCDSAYALLGCLALGQHETALDTLDLLRELSTVANGSSGRTIHECTTAGRVADKGRVNETAQFVSIVWQACRWTGDLAFLRRNYDFCKRGLLDWTIGEHTTDGTVLPSGYGMIEVEGLDGQCLDVAAYTVSGLQALAAMAATLGDDGTARECRERITAINSELEQVFWLEAEGLYGDVLATPREIAAIVERLAATAPDTHEFATLRQRVAEDPEPDRKRPWLLKNWTVLAPMEVGIADRDRAERALDRIEGPEFVGPWGMYVNPLTSSDCMSVSTGALIASELNYGRVDRALALIRMVAGTLIQGMPGAIAEILPDRGCFVQAWSGYAIAWPIVNGIFGLRPDALRRQLTIVPQFPAGWPRAELRHVRMGDAVCDVEWDGNVVRVHMSDPAWNVVMLDSSSAAKDAWTSVSTDASRDGGRTWIFRPTNP